MNGTQHYTYQMKHMSMIVSQTNFRHSDNNGKSKQLHDLMKTCLKQL